MAMDMENLIMVMKLKRRNKLSLVILLLTGLSAWGQSDAQFEQYLSLQEKSRQTSNNSGYWAVSLSGGISLYQGESDGEVSKKDLFTPYGKLVVARWFSSVWGIRWQASGGTQKNSHVMMKEPDTNGKFYFADTYLTFVTNLMNWGTYKSSHRPIGLYLYLGGGGAWTPERDGKSQEFSPAALLGGNLNIRMTDYWSLTLGLEGTIVKDNFNGYTGGRKYEGYAGVTAGMTYRFPDKK